MEICIDFNWKIAPIDGIEAWPGWIGTKDKEECVNAETLPHFQRDAPPPRVMRQRTAAKTRRVNPREFQYTNFAPVFARLARLATLLLLVSSSCHSPDNFLAPTDNYHSSFEAALSSNLAREIFWSEPERQGDRTRENL